ncbi:hypothetical protein ACX3O0_15790 [Homoserinimonas sp. A447]
MTNPADESLPPEEMLRLLRQQQDRVRNELSAPIPWLLGIWGVAWLVGFLLLWSAWPGGNPWFQVPMTIAGTTFAVLMIGSIVASAVLGVRMGRGVRGESDFAGAVYGLSWSLCGVAFAAVGVGLISNGLSTELASIYFPSAYALMVGTLYLGGAALWRDKGQLVLGIVLLVIGSVAPFFGAPTNNLVMALAGGGAFLISALLAARDRG